MALTEEQIEEFRKELTTSLRPLFFFDDDPDGVCSFVMLHKISNEGKGIALKTRPRLDEKFLRKVEEYKPDKIFVLDIPDVTQEFIDNSKTKIVWLDHHAPNDRKNVKYFNPMINDPGDNRPTSYWSYLISKQNIWLAMTGCLGDWFIPDFEDRFREEYLGLFEEGITSPAKALFATPMGNLARMISFILKGKTSEVNTCIKILTRIKDPREILEQLTSQGKYIFKKYDKINKHYQRIMGGLKVTDDPFLIFIYSDDKNSFTSEISNELLYKYPDKFIIVGRDRNGEIKMSLRSSKEPVLPRLKKALVGIDGYGGGHELACGACVKKHDFEEFIRRMRQES